MTVRGGKLYLLLRETPQHANRLPMLCCHSPKILPHAVSGIGWKALGRYFA
jgi:hypothetical protein